MAVANKIPVLNLTRISTSVYNSKKQIGLTNQVISNRVKSIQESVANQRRLISESNLYYQRRQEIDEKNKQEAALEAPDTVKTLNYNNQETLSSPSDKGFLGRLLGFAGYLAAGWILTRLPQLIKFGEQFLVRLQTAKDIIGNFFNITLASFQSFGKLLGGILTNVSRLDINGAYTSITTNFEELETNLYKMGGSLQTAFSFIIDPLGFKVAERQELEQSQETQQSTDAYADDGTAPGGGPMPTGPIDTGPVPKNDREAFEKVRAAAQKAGSPAPDVTASIAMIETGWLRNPNSVYFASKKTNPFGQTGRGSAGYVVGADGQDHAVYRSFDEGVATHVRLWKKYYKGNTADEILRNLVAAGYNTASSGWRPNIASTYERMTKKSRNAPVSAEGTPGPSPSGAPSPNINSQSRPTGQIKSIGGGHSLDSSAAAAFMKMRDEAKKQGVNLTLKSSYRTYQEQQYLYNLYLQGRGNLAARPGTSLHEKGLSIDVGNGIPWIQKYGSKFGWINTGMTFSQKEPWHFDFKGSVPPSSTQEQKPSAAIQRPTDSRSQMLSMERQGEDYIVIDQRSPRRVSRGQMNRSSSGIMLEEDLSQAFTNNMKKRLMNDLAYV